MFVKIEILQGVEEDTREYKVAVSFSPGLSIELVKSILRSTIDSLEEERE